MKKDMRKVFTEAHRITREMVKEYGMDYRTQFAITLSYLLNKEDEQVKLIKKEEVRDFEDGMLTLTTSNNQRAWVAEITGTDEKYGFARSFINEPTVDGGRWVDYELSEGKIYNWNEGRRQHFGIVENGKLYEISKRDVENLIA